MSWKIRSDKDIAVENPELHKELMNAVAKAAQLNPKLYEKYRDKTCLECDRPRQIPESRYCNQHYWFFKKKHEQDWKTGRRMLPNYSYSIPGYNIGLDAYVHDSDHFKALSKRFAESEGLQSIG